MTIDVTDLTTEELKAEIERRERKAKTPPTPLQHPNFAKLQNLIVQGVHTAVENERTDKDFEHYVYEAAMEAVYGKDFWKWRNAQKW